MGEDEPTHCPAVGSLRGTWRCDHTCVKRAQLAVFQCSPAQTAPRFSKSAPTSRAGDCGLLLGLVRELGNLGWYVCLLWLLWQHSGQCDIRQQTMIPSEVPNARVPGVASSEAGLEGLSRLYLSLCGDAWLVATF